MDNEQTKKINAEGVLDNKDIPKSDTPLSIVEEARKVRDEIRQENNRREEILKKEQELKSNEILAGTSGGHIEPKVVDPEELKKAGAKEFFKGTQLADAIDKL